MNTKGANGGGCNRPSAPERDAPTRCYLQPLASTSRKMRHNQRLGSRINLRAAPMLAKCKVQVSRPTSAAMSLVTQTRIYKHESEMGCPRYREMQHPVCLHPDAADCDNPGKPRDTCRPSTYVTDQTKDIECIPGLRINTTQHAVWRDAKGGSAAGETRRCQWRRGTSRKGTREIDSAACSMQV